MSIQNPTLSAAADLAHFSRFRHLRHFRHFIRRGGFSPLYTNFRSTIVEIALQISSILTNKPNFRNDKMNITLDMTTYYKILSRWKGQKTKPIQTQLKPIQSQFNPKQTQFKPNNQSSLITNHLEGWFHQTNILVTIP